MLQFTLDLFAADAHPPKATQAIAPYVPGEPLSDAVAPAVFRHPRASRETRIAQALVAYEFLRARRRTIGFSVGPDGLSVRAPRWTPVVEVEAAIQQKGRWILEKLDALRQRRALLESARIEWRHGATLPYLGGQIVLQLDPEHRFTGKGAALVCHGAIPHALHIGLSFGAQPEQIRDAVQAWLMAQARQNFESRIAHYAPLLGVHISSLKLSNAGTRWGSASANRTIRLNWRLIHFRQPVIDYVVAHELSHLRVMDHSPRFWETVASVVPDYPTLRAQLKDESVPRW
jgi:predicted metal-dependent hydrolase